ncbi:hypothetical protein MNBD_GAMMA08-1055, partial [hydrothermal vent metagenome]
NQHIEHFSANAPINELPVDEQVIIEDFLMHYNVYECNSEQEAEKIAHWHLKKYYNYIPEKLEVKKISERAYSIDLTSSPP